MIALPRSSTLRAAAMFSVAAGAVHLVAARAHADIAALGTLLVAAGAAQILWAAAMLVTTSGSVVLLGAAANLAAVAVWVVSRTAGLPFAGEAGEKLPLGFQDLAAAALGLGAALVVIAAVRPSLVGGRRPDARMAAVVAVGIGLLGAIASHDHAAPDQSVPVAEAGLPAARLPGAEAVALLQLSARPVLGDRVAIDHSHGGGGHGSGFEEPGPPEELSSREAERFAEQWEAARAAASRLATPEAAAAAGYVQASTPVPGVGAHWVKWSLVDRPFDPGLPSMLLFDTVTAGAGPELVGLSYWVASADVPEGFAGPNDSWHNHRGMCFVNGWLRDEGVELREDCADTWIDGADLWMLHAWPAEDVSNPWGVFADVNPYLCRNRPHVPDALSCNPVGI